MTTKTGGDFFKAQAFTQSLRTLLESLPSDDERQQVSSQLDALIRFLTELREKVTSIPSRDDATAARAALDRLDAWFATAKANPVVATAFGVKPRAVRGKPAPFSAEDAERARAAVARFDTLPIDEVRTALNRMLPRELQSVASAMGIRTTRRSTHDALAQQIATKITNSRGYRSLREGSDEQPPPADKANK
jgi:hypothetical protein